MLQVSLSFRLEVDWAVARITPVRGPHSSEAPPPLQSDAGNLGRLHSGSGVSQGTRVVTVMINGVSRSGVVNDQGEIVVTSESPKFFEIRMIGVTRMGRGVNQVKRLGVRGVIHSVHKRYLHFEERVQKGLLRCLPTSTTSSIV